MEHAEKNDLTLLYAIKDAPDIIVPISLAFSAMHCYCRANNLSDFGHG